jgi:anthranilate 1,2-dioxygenase small subunit
MNEMADTIAMRFDPALRDGVENLMSDYVHSLDDNDIDRWPQFFTDDSIYHVTTRENYEAGLPIGIIRCVGRGMMLDRIKAFHTANIFEPHVYNHLTDRPSLRAGASAQDYVARSNFQVVRIMQDGRADLFASGKYLDVVTLDKGVFKFRERIVVLDSRHVDILMVVPI